MNALTRRGGLFDEFFRDFSPGYFVQPLHGDPLPGQVKLDVRESEGAFEVQAEVPGVKKEDIQVEVDGNVLSLRAEVRQEDGTEGGEGRSPAPRALLRLGGAHRAAAGGRRREPVQGALRERRAAADAAEEGAGEGAAPRGDRMTGEEKGPPGALAALN
jgi:hypothetical protein